MKKKRIKEYEDIIDTTTEHLQKCKESAKGIDKNAKNICVSVDNALDTLQKEKIFLKAVSEFESCVKNELWKTHERNKISGIASCNTASELADELMSQNKELANLSSTVDILNIAVGSGAATTFNTFSNIQEPDFQRNIKEIEIEDNTFDNIETIKINLAKINPSTVQKFECVVRDWSGSEDNQKHKILLNLRSVIYHQLLDIIAPEKNYCKAPWYKNGFKKRYCQMKFFILGMQDESKLLKSMLMQVEQVANDSQRYFDLLSKLGKYGGSRIDIETVFKATISTFALALRIRNSLP